MEMQIRPISIREANEYVEKYHRHHSKKTGCRFAICVCDQGGCMGLLFVPILSHEMRMMV